MVYCRWSVSEELNILHETFIMSSPPDSVSKGIVFLVCSSIISVRLFVRPFVLIDIVTAISDEWLEQS